jgi:hypothetical protein
MRRKRSVPGLAVLAASLALVLVLFAADVLVVKVQTSQLRLNPQFFAAGVAPLKAGDRLEKLSEAAGWFKVRTAAGTIGWVHSSAVEPPRVQVTAGAANMKTQASASEVALAGKGFNRQVEDSFKAKNKGVSFVWVDKMIASRASSAEIQDFLKRGRLTGAGGGR